MDRFPYIQTLIQIQLGKIKNVRTIIDVGAYKGEFLKILNSLCPEVTIHAIEPDFKCANVISEIQNPNIILHRLAITLYDGEVILYSEDKDGPSASNTIYDGLLDDRELTNKAKVPCMTFKTFCDTEKINDIDLLIINAEGAEYEMFEHESSREMIFRSKIIDLSLHGKSFFFNTKDYAQKRIDINNHLMRNKYKIVYGEIIKDLRMSPNHIRQVWIK